MRLSLLTTAVFSAMALSLPTADPIIKDAAVALEDRSIAASPAATIFRAQYRKGGNLAQDFTYISGEIPACNDLSGIFGSWDRATRSIAVNPGYSCRFYTESLTCGGKHLTLGEKGKAVVRDTLSGEWDRKIRSAVCVRL